MATTLDEIVDTFELLGDWDQRYQYLVELGERLAPMDPADKTDTNRVMECMSTVHVVPKPMDGSARLRYAGDCDTAIIKGVLALLIDLCSGKTAAEIEKIDMDEIFAQLQLGEHLSPNRHVGIYAIVDLMKSQARKLSSQETEGA